MPQNAPSSKCDPDSQQREDGKGAYASPRPFDLHLAERRDDRLPLLLALLWHPSWRRSVRRGWRLAQWREQDKRAEDPEWGEHCNDTKRVSNYVMSEKEEGRRTKAKFEEVHREREGLGCVQGVPWKRDCRLLVVGWRHVRGDALPARVVARLVGARARERERVAEAGVHWVDHARLGRRPSRVCQALGWNLDGCGCEECGCGSRHCKSGLASKSLDSSKIQATWM
jgi:hypothetical protein